MKIGKARMQRRRRGQAGTTIIEALVAISLLAVGASAIGTFLTNQIRIAASTYLVSTAYSMAERELEDLRSLDYDDMVSRTSSKLTGAVTFALATTVTPNVPSPNMKTINVSVSWTDNGGSKNVLVSTIFTQVHR